MSPFSGKGPEPRGERCEELIIAFGQSVGYAPETMHKILRLILAQAFQSHVKLCEQPLLCGCVTRPAILASTLGWLMRARWDITSNRSPSSRVWFAAAVPPMPT